MARVLSFVLLGALLFLAVSASEDETETDLVESLEVDPMAEADPTGTADADAKRRKRRKNKPKNKRKGKKGKKKRKGRGKKKTHGKAKSRSGPGCQRQDDACIANIVTVLNHVGTIVTNFLSQNARQERFRTLATNKKGKATDFDESSGLLETAKTGSNTCGSDATTLSATLKNCSANVAAKCEAASDIVDTTLLDECKTMFTATKTGAADCCSKSSAAEKCSCMAGMVSQVTDAKVDTCRKAGIAANKATKDLRTTCLSAFQDCKKAEDSSISEINLCKGGTEPSANTGGRRFRMNMRIQS